MSYSVNSVTQIGPATLRVTFSAPPLMADANGANDALNLSLYSLAGNGVIHVVQAVPVEDFGSLLDLTTDTAFPDGQWVLTIGDVRRPRGDTLTSNSFTFIAGHTFVLASGAAEETAHALLRKHLASSLVGKAWDAIVAAVAVIERYNWDTAKLAFAQLFKSTASGIYLDKRAGEDGVVRPPNIGMSDDLYRQLAIKTTAAKLTYEVLLEILEIFYGSDAVRANATTASYSPYSFTSGDSLILLMDERDVVPVVFLPTDFASITSATAFEVAAAINRAMRQAGNSGWAVGFADPTGGGNLTKVYSGSLGLSSSVRIIGGRAQLALNFPNRINSYPGTVTVGDGYSWAVTSPAPGLNRLTLQNTGTSKVDLSLVQVGDYVVFGVPSSTITAGTYQVQAVDVKYSGATLIQSYDISGSVADHSFTSSSNYEQVFYRPIRETPNSDRVAVVAQTTPDMLDIVIPATTQAVNRTINTAAYLHSLAAPLTISSLIRRGSTLTGQTSSPHGLAAGDQIFVDEAYAGAAAPTLVTGSSGTSDASLATIWTNISPENGLGRLDHALVTLADGSVLNAGGHRIVSAVDTWTNTSQTFKITGSSVLGDGAVQYTYTWTDTGPMPSARSHFAATLLPSGEVFAAGGYDGTAWLATSALYSASGATWRAGPALTQSRRLHTQTMLGNGKVLIAGGSSSASATRATCELYSYLQNTISAGGSLIEARVEHTACLLADGRVLVCGGRSVANSTFNSLNSCEIYDPGTNTWSSTGRMSYARYGHTALTLPDGRVLVIGGTGYVNVAYSTGEIQEAEIWNPATGCWSPAGRMPTVRSFHGAVYLPTKNKVLVAGGADGLSAAHYYDVSSGKWTNTAPATGSLSGNPGVNAKLAGMPNGMALLVGGQTGEAPQAGFLFQPGEDFNNSGGLAGVFTVTNVPTASSFECAVAPIGYAKNTSATISSYPMKAVAGPSIPGPFVLNPTDGIAITEISTLTSMPLRAGGQYRTLTVVDASAFPDAPGWLVISFGTQKEAVIPYLGKLSSTQLSLDYSFEVPASNDSGATVTWLKKKGPWFPASPETAGLSYLTASSAGRVAAVSSLQASLAAGVGCTISVVYPGDKGLGGAGLGVTGPRISDKVAVWGSDDLDTELAIARGTK